MANSRQQSGAFAHADRLEIGDRIPAFALADSEGRPVTPISNDLSGRPLLLVFECRAVAEAPSFADELAALRDRNDELRDRDAVVLALTRREGRANGDLEQAQALPFPVLSDPEAKVYDACGLDPRTVGRTTVTLALDGNLRIVGIIDGGGASRWSAIAEALDCAAGHDSGQPLDGHPPVLVLPRVLTPEDCTALIDVWHRPVPLWEGYDFKNEGFDQEEGDFKAGLSDHGRVVQFVVRDPEVQRFLDAKLNRRVLPEIMKTFQTRVSQREEYRIAAYDSAEDGRLGPHRDNTTGPTRHRRFTMAVALNDDFEGGGLRFREYGEEGYRVPPGTAIVWSCALLHEVLPVTAGRRFILGTHLFGS